MNLKGFFTWSAYVGIGCVFAVPLAARLLFRFLRNPFAFCHRKDNWAASLPPPVPNIFKGMVEVGPKISIYTVRTFQGPPTKPAMVLVSGFPEFYGSWRHQIAAFRDRYDIVAVHMRGYSLSSKPKGVANYASNIVAGDIAAVIRSLSVENVVLVGHDWGGAICWFVAHIYPRLISKLVIACAPHPKVFMRNMDFDQFLRSWYIFAFQVPLLAELALWSNGFSALDDYFLKAPMGVRRDGALTHEDVEGYKQELARPGALTATISYYRAMLIDAAYGTEPAVRAALRRRLEVPTLCIWADGDVALGPQLLRGVGRYVEKLKVVMLRECSHWAQVDRPEDFNAAMAEFLKE